MFQLTNIGKKWYKYEDDQLLQELNNNINIEIIAKKHKRTIGGIISRIKILLSEKNEDLMEMDIDDPYAYSIYIKCK